MFVTATLRDEAISLTPISFQEVLRALNAFVPEFPFVSGIDTPVSELSSGERTLAFLCLLSAFSTVAANSLRVLLDGPQQMVSMKNRIRFLGIAAQLSPLVEFSYLDTDGASRPWSTHP
jgi:hypothetical protein